MTCDFKFCRFCGHGDECSANGHQQSQCKYKQLQEANKTIQDAVASRFQATDEPWTINVDTLEVGAPFRPQFINARPDAPYYGVTAGTAGTTYTHTARNLDLGF